MTCPVRAFHSVNSSILILLRHQELEKTNASLKAENAQLSGKMAAFEAKAKAGDDKVRECDEKMKVYDEQVGSDVSMLLKISVS